jgi:hypothetical protein
MLASRHRFMPAVHGGGMARRKKRARSIDPGACHGELDLEPVRFTLTDDQRTEISRLSGIPKDEADAWEMIETVIGLYRRRKAQAERSLLPAEIRNELRRLSKGAFNLQKRLLWIIDLSPSDYTLSFTDELTCLRKVEMNLFVAADNFGSDKSGPSTRDVYKLVAMLDGI